MKKFNFIFLLLFYSSRLLASQSYVINCDIYNEKQELIRKFPGRMCQFFEDGSFLSAVQDKLVYYDKFLTKVWSKDLYPHHQFNMSLDEKKILVIGSEIVELKADSKLKESTWIRSDVLYVMSRDGKILNQFNLYENRSQFDKKSWKSAMDRKFPIVWDLSLYKKAKWEVTHTNSFHEIPDNKIAIKIPAFKKGNFLVNDISLMQSFVLSSDLKTVLWQDQIIHSDWTMFHDVQVVENSENIIFYDNGTPLRPETRLVEYNLVKNDISWQYPKELTTSFYSKKMGGLQLLENGDFLYNDLTKSAEFFEVNRKGEKVKSFLLGHKYSLDLDKNPFQQVKKMDLSKFLENQRGL